jgi:hypothetical protein
MHPFLVITEHHILVCGVREAVVAVSDKHALALRMRADEF